MFRFSAVSKALIGAVVVVLLPATAASASAPVLSSEATALSVYQSSNPAAAFAALPAAQQRAFADRMSTWTAVEFQTRTWKRTPTAQEMKAMGTARASTRTSPAQHATGSADLALAGGCWSQYKYHKWYDLGLNTGDTWMTAHWCSNGSSITSYSLSNRGGQGYKGIEYKGLGGTYRSNVGWEVRQAQSFKFSVLWANANPCMQIRGGRTGLYSYRATCNLS